MSKRDVVTHGVTPEHFESDEEKKLRKIEEGRNLWYRKVIRYKKPTESNRQFATRCGLTDGGIVGRWFYEGRKPQKPTEARRILESLGVPEDEAKEIMFGLIGMEPETQTETVSTAQGYVYPDSEGIENASGRLGFKAVFLDTNKIKSASVKLVVCDTQSMVPEIRPKDMMLIDMSKTSPVSGKTYLMETEDGTILCELYPVHGKKYSVIFKNNDVYPNYQIPQEECVIHGEVVFIGRLL